MGFIIYYQNFSQLILFVNLAVFLSVGLYDVIRIVYNISLYKYVHERVRERERERERDERERERERERDVGLTCLVL